MRQAIATPKAHLAAPYPLAVVKLPSDVASRWNDHEWLHNTTRLGGPNIIKWNRKVGFAERLTDTNNAHLLELARRYYCYLRYDLGGRSELERSTAIGRVYTFMELIGWLRGLGLQRFSQVSFSQLEDLMGSIERGIPAYDGSFRPSRARVGRVKQNSDDSELNALTDGRIKIILEVVFDLYLLFMHPSSDGAFLFSDGFKHRPLENYLHLLTFAENKGRPQDQIEDINEELVFQYCDVALQFIFDYADDIIALNEKNGTLPPYEATRLRSGEISSRISEAIISDFARSTSKMFKSNDIDFRAVATSTGITPTSAYHARHRQKLESARSFRHSTDQEAKQMFLDGLRTEILKFQARSTQKLQDRNRADRLGLPYVGKNFGTASPWPITHVSYANNTESSLEGAVSDLWTSIYIIIFAWLGERTEEGQSIPVDCLELAIDGYYIKSLTFKGANGTSGTGTRMACPEIVVRAVQIAQRLGKSAREESGSNFLFCEQTRMGIDVIDPSTLRNRFKRFGAKYVKSPLVAEYNLVPMHLRRFFVTLWVHYHSYGGRFEALRKHFNHGSIAVTILYASRRVKANTVRQEQTKMTFRILSEVAYGGLKIIGPSAARISAILSRFTFKLESPLQFAQQLTREIEENQARVYPMAYGFCLWTNGASKRARCRTPNDPGTTEHWPAERKTHTTCAVCDNFFTSPVFVPFWERARLSAKERVENERAPAVLRTFSRMALRITTKICRKFGAGNGS